MRFGAQENRGLLDEGLVVLGELEAILFECFPEVVQLRIVVMAGGAGRLVLPRKRGDRGSLRNQRKHCPQNDHNRGQTRHDAAVNYVPFHLVTLQVLPTEVRAKSPEPTGQVSMVRSVPIIQLACRDVRH